MKVRLLLLAMLSWASACIAGSVSANGFYWQYERFGEGVCITDVSIEGSAFPNTTLTIPERLQEDGEWLNVVAIVSSAIGYDRSDQWNNVTSIVLPKTLTALLDWNWEESEYVNPLDWSLFDSSEYEEVSRTTPLTLVVQGPVLKNLYANPCYKEVYDEEDGYFTYVEDGYFNLQLPTDVTCREQWEKVLTDEVLVLFEEDEGSVIWHDLKVVDFKPNLDARVNKIANALEACKASTDATGDNILDALKLLVGLQQNPTLLQFAKDAGFVTIANGVWTVAEVTYETVETQPNEVLETLLSQGVLSQLEGAITKLNSVSADWQGYAEIKPSDEIPLSETLYIDVTDALLMKASLEGLVSKLHLLSSYNLEWDYAQPIKEPPLTMGDVDDPYSKVAWKNVPQKVIKDLETNINWTVQVADYEGDLVFRLTPEYTNDDFAAVESNWWGATYLEIFGWPTDSIEWSEDAILFFHFGLAPYYEEILEEGEDEWFALYYYDAYGMWHWIWLEAESYDPQRLFESQPELFNGRVANANLQDAKRYFGNACATMRVALKTLATRSDKDEHLFNLSTEVAEEDLDIADAYLEKALSSLEGETEIKVKEITDTLNLAPLFTQQGPERKHLPKIVNGEFVEESAIDPTYCGILPKHAPQTDGKWIVTKSVSGDWTVTGHQLPETTTDVELPTEVKLSDSETVSPNKAGYRLFADNSTLAKVVIPSSYSVGVETFKNCTSLKELIFDAPKMLEIGGGAFEGVALTHVTAATLPREVNTQSVEKWRVATGTSYIPYYYYDDPLAKALPALKHLILPASLEYIDGGAIAFGETAPVLETVTFEGRPPMVSYYDQSPFAYTNAVGYYPYLYADDWIAEMSSDGYYGYWNELWMETMKIAWECSGGGSVTIMNGATEDGSSSPGEEITLKAIPDEGMVFVGWSGDIKGATNPVRVTIQENMSTTAHFLPQALYLALMQNAGGGLSGTTLEEYVNAVIAERGLITEDQVYSINAGIPLFKVQGGKVSLRLHLKSTNSLATWSAMDLSEADLTMENETGELTITVPVDPNEKASFYKFVVPETP